MEDVMFSADDNFIGVTSKKNQLVVWDIESSKELYRGEKDKDTLAKYFKTVAPKE